jgi:hypothetical protein
MGATGETGPAGETGPTGSAGLAIMTQATGPISFSLAPGAFISVDFTSLVNGYYGVFIDTTDSLIGFSTTIFKTSTSAYGGARGVDLTLGGNSYLVFYRAVPPYTFYLRNLDTEGLITRSGNIYIYYVGPLQS